MFAIVDDQLLKVLTVWISLVLHMKRSLESLTNLNY
jgi:hypothetical protein